MGRTAARAENFDTFGSEKGRSHKLIEKQRYPQMEKDGIFWFKRALTARTPGQQRYIDTVNESDITLCSGPAGCGKTWVVARLALEALARNQVSRIIITKPIIEAGSERLGALPGEMELKVEPYFSAILDCFEDHIGPTILKRLLDSKKIVFIPLAYMRGRDLKFSFVLADEAQNMTRKAIRLLLTRMGEGSTMVLNGDTDQIDLPNERDSGLHWAVQALTGKHGRIGVIELKDADIQRHALTRTILDCLRQA